MALTLRFKSPISNLRSVFLHDLLHLLCLCPQDRVLVLVPILPKRTGLFSFAVRYHRVRKMNREIQLAADHQATFAPTPFRDTPFSHPDSRIDWPSAGRRENKSLIATVPRLEIPVSSRQINGMALSNRNKNGILLAASCRSFRPLQSAQNKALWLLAAVLLALFPTLASEPPKSSCDVPGACICLKMPSMPGMQQTAAQSNSGMSMPGMSKQNMPKQGMSQQQMSMGMTAPTTFIEQIVNHESAGTTAEPAATPHDMLMTQRGAWTLMFHGSMFVNATQQSGPRGTDKVFSTSWLMPMAQRTLGLGTLTARAMFSLEPATITNRRYPELFQVGETAYGNPIVDGQHPHNFFMEIAAIYDIKLGDNTLLSFYAAPVGDPAIGPEAYPHRVSASEDPLAALGHHLQDSTHISYDVVTLGFAYKIARIEVSGFHGQEPGENRWTIGAGAIDSWSTRLTINPAPDWSGQYSIARLKSPEALFPTEDTLRMTSSITYDRPLNHNAKENTEPWGNWATTLVWGRNESLPGGEIFNSYLAESTVRFAHRNFAWTRVENVDRTNELLLGDNPLPPGFEEHFLARIQAYTLGYDREFKLIPHISSALGGQFTLYGKPASLDSLYGDHPIGALLFLRLRPAAAQK